MSIQYDCGLLREIRMDDCTDIQSTLDLAYFQIYILYVHCSGGHRTETIDHARDSIELTLTGVVLVWIVWIWNTLSLKHCDAIGFEVERNRKNVSTLNLSAYSFQLTVPFSSGHILVCSYFEHSINNDLQWGLFRGISRLAIHNLMDSMNRVYKSLS